MSAYLHGCDVLGADSDMDLHARPMSADRARRIIAVVIASPCSPEAKRQLSNIDSSIERSGRTAIPDEAADVLGALIVGHHVAAPEEDILGEDAYTVLGMFDIQTSQKQMNGLKKVTVRAAQALLKGGQEAISGAQALAAQRSLPGGTARDNVAAHLKWHQDALAKLSGGSPNDFYSSGDDLKKYVMQAFIESNAVEEGAAYLDVAWTTMWKEIADAIKALPAEVRAAVANAASGLVENITGLPVWAWGLIAAGTVGLLGFVGWKIANSRAGAAVAGTVASRYLR